MFGFMCKEKESYERKEAERRAWVIHELKKVLLHITYESATFRGITEDHPDFKPLMEKQGKIVMGFEMFRAGAHPHDISDHEPIVKAGTEIAHNASREVALKGGYNAREAARRYLFLYGFLTGKEIW